MSNMCTDEREIWDDHGIEVIDESTYRIVGRPYTIRWVGRTEDGYGHLWECDCPSRKTCKHIRAVAEAEAEVRDLLGLD